MERFSQFVTHHKKAVIIFFTTVFVLSAFLLFFVQINYNMVDYLPADAQSTTALEIMNREFDASIPNASVMARDVSVAGALKVKERLAAVPGVEQVLWLDDVMDVKQPLELGDADTVEGFYKDGHALFSLTIAKGAEQETCRDILAILGPQDALTGEVPALVNVMDMAVSNVLKAFAILLPIIILILVLTSRSWIEPLLFLLAIGVSVVVNMGTNVFLGEVSFMTNSISPILQLACSLDYAIFLLHSFEANRKKYATPQEAMRQAMKESVSTVAASAATTLFGFLALLFMRFGIGADLGINLAKGILLSFISVMVFLPALTLAVCPLLDKTQHKRFFPEFKNAGKVFSKLAVPAVVLVLVVLLPAFLGQRRTEFLYGNETIDLETRYGRDTVAVEEQFGKSTVLAVLVPRGDAARERLLGEDLADLPRVTGVTSYATTVGAVIPPEYLGQDITGQFYSENYARLIVYTDTPAEGDVAFATVEAISQAAQAHYPDAFYTLGESANLYDMKNIVQKDNVVVNLIAVVAIFLVLVVTFRSAILPFLLVLTIEAGIWINLAIPYFSGTQINFLGYLVLSTIQLGATVDYAILLTNTYLSYRRRMPKREAMLLALDGTFKSLVVSALTLSIAGFTLSYTSSNSAVMDIGLLLGRGTLLSLGMVVLFLPTLLLVFDKPIHKLTYKANFFQGKTTTQN